MTMRRTKMPRRPVSRRKTFKAAQPWTREEISFMRKYYRKYETTWIARQLGRTVYSIRYKAVDLSIKKASPSIWKGNKGNANAFRRSPSTRMSRPASSRTKTTRRTNRTKKYRASTDRRMTRRTASRKTTMRRRTRR